MRKPRVGPSRVRRDSSRERVRSLVLRMSRMMRGTCPSMPTRSDSRPSRSASPISVFSSVERGRRIDVLTTEKSRPVMALANSGNCSSVIPATSCAYFCIAFMSPSLTASHILAYDRRRLSGMSR
ncbi:hypothetical protein DL765_010787 [Monosporascus sp. GIB2]|nr:hypothetical protein DL765_010787 [Monosporascus sp. GIB2]